MSQLYDAHPPAPIPHTPAHHAHVVPSGLFLLSSSGHVADVPVQNSGSSQGCLAALVQSNSGVSVLAAAAQVVLEPWPEALVCVCAGNNLCWLSWKPSHAPTKTHTTPTCTALFLA